jgi:hypothetical protein
MKHIVWSRHSLALFLMLFVVHCFYGCKDDETSAQDFDPSKPIEVTSFTPTSGSV